LIQERRLRVTRIVNRELFDLYWEIGKHLDERIDSDGWGKGTVRQLAEHLLGHEAGLRGFSVSNLWRMRQFYQTWRSAPEELATVSRVFPAQSRQHFKDSYVMEFLGLPAAHSETDLRRALVHRLGQFLRELGRVISASRQKAPSGQAPRVFRTRSPPKVDLLSC
jgi:hypothetical protein